MDSAMQRVESMDSKIAFTVLGFIRNAKALLSSTALFQNIPPLISRIVLCYSQKCESFHSVAGAIKMLNGKQTVRASEYSYWSSAYGSIGIPSVSNICCYWKIKIDKRVNNWFIGITSDSKRSSRHWMHDINTTVYKHTFYCLLCYEESQKTDNMGLRKSYAKKLKGIKEGDVVSIKLNLKEQVISFAVNEVDYGTAFSYIRSDADTKYYLALGLIGRNAQASIADFGYF